MRPVPGSWGATEGRPLYGVAVRGYGAYYWFDIRHHNLSIEADLAMALHR